MKRRKVRPSRCGRRVEAVECEGEQEKEGELVELGGMAWDAVAEVDAPWECGGCAASVVCEAGEEAADAADGDAEAEWDGEEVAGAGADVGEALDELDGEPAAEEAADDGFAAAGEGEELMEVEAAGGGVLEQAEDAAAEESADGGGGDDPPAVIVGERVTVRIALVAIDSIAAGVTEGLEDGVERRVGQHGLVR